MNRNIEYTQSAKDAELHRAVTEVLGYMGISPKYSGFVYLRDAIKYSVGREVTPLMTKEVYPEVARHWMTTAKDVEVCMRTAIRRGWEGAEPAARAELFGSQTLPPTNTLFVRAAADHVRCGSTPGNIQGL